MPKTEITKFAKNISFSKEVYEYLQELVAEKQNASRHVDEAVRATDKFQKHQQEKKNESTY